MKATCPECNSKQFVTVAHVTEDWVVNENGEFVEVFGSSDTYVVHGPRAGNIWICYKCGEEAKVEE